jgi:cysteine desulfurase/selenocysteine lyase
MKPEVHAPVPFSAYGTIQPVLGSRELFPHLKYNAYLAHAAISPACSAVLEASVRCARSVAELGVAAFPIWNEQRERLRQSLADLLNVPASQLALTGGCTHGITDVALSLPWRSGDRMLVFQGEFPANVAPWQLAARSHNAHLEFLPLPDSRDSDCSTQVLANLEKSLDEASQAGIRVPWVAVSAVQFQSGLRMPLLRMAEVCHGRNALLFVDGIQACGAIPLDLPALGVDAFFGGAHKWLLGLEGVGFSFLAQEVLAQLQPLTAGWLSFEGGDEFLFRGAGHLRYDRSLHKSARVFEGSSSNSVGFAALEVGVEIARLLSPVEIYRHIQTYHDAVEGTFVDRGFVSLRPVDVSLRSGILSFKLPPDIAAPAFAQELKARGVMVSIPDGLLRLAPHFSNDLEEVTRVAEAVDETLSVLRG